jgi:hypothetical protein
MANKEWDNATVEKKLEMLRKDVSMLTDAYDGLRRAHNQQLLKLWNEVQELKDSRRKNGVV